ncbi:MAG: hypothetical protein JWR26_1175, partial [Pedosphaera sp.]|nr:hypothetical protein [Pedosphaera sp.]
MGVLAHGHHKDREQGEFNHKEPEASSPRHAGALNDGTHWGTADLWAGGFVARRSQPH